MFESAILADEPSSRRRWTMPVSLFLQAFLVSTLVVIPLIFTEKLGIVPIRPQFTLPIRHLPVPPDFVQRSISAMRSSVPRIFIVPDARLRAKSQMPTVAQQIMDEVPPGIVPADPGIYFRRENGIHGGIPMPSEPPPPQPKPKVEQAAKPNPPPGPLPVGGDVKQPVLIRQVHPIYPPLARHARVEGIVRINAILTKDGRFDPCSWLPDTRCWSRLLWMPCNSGSTGQRSLTGSR